MTSAASRTVALRRKVASLTPSQRDALERLVKHGSLISSNRNGGRAIHSKTGSVLETKGFATYRYFEQRYEATDIARAVVGERRIRSRPVHTVIVRDGLL